MSPAKSDWSLTRRFTMKVHRNFVLIIIALALVGIFAGTANAQAVVKDAHFTLPFRATWADTVLPPGDYTLSVTRVSGNSRGLLYRVDVAGAGTKHAILALRPLGPRVGEASMLVAARGGEMYSIRALHLPSADLVLTFPAPKAKDTLMAMAPGPIRSVPILIAAK
jgi:hypothetical protein